MIFPLNSLLTLDFVNNSWKQVLLINKNIQVEQFSGLFYFFTFFFTAKYWTNFQTRILKLSTSMMFMFWTFHLYVIISVELLQSQRY